MGPNQSRAILIFPITPTITWPFAGYPYTTGTQKAAKVSNNNSFFNWVHSLHTELMNASHSTNSFSNSCDHTPWLTPVHFLPNILHQLFFFWFRFKRLIAKLFLRYSSRFVLASLLHVSFRYDENKQTFAIQRDTHSFIEIGSLLPPLPISHNYTAFPKKSQSPFTVLNVQSLLRVAVRKNRKKNLKPLANFEKSITFILSRWKV